MIDALLRYLHVQWWIPFAVWYGLYMLWAFQAIVNGYGQEYMGWRHPGRPGKIHNILLRFHTGAHVHPDRSYGDEVWRDRAVGGRGTVYWHQHGRMFRCIRNNGIVIAILTILSMMVVNPRATVIAVTLTCVAGILIWVVLQIRKLRKKYLNSRPLRPVRIQPIARTAAARQVIDANPAPELEAPETDPKLEGVPLATLAALLSTELGCSTAEVISLLTITPDAAELMLPDSFSAVPRKKENVVEIIEAHFKGKISFSWMTTQAPRMLSWVPVVEHRLPTYVRYRDHLDHIRALGPREFGVGLEADRSYHDVTHNGDKPWHCRFAGSGTGKSMGFLVKAATVCNKDPYADVYGIDTKQVSFEYLHEIPHVYIYDNPQSEMERIWRVFYELAGLMRDRYTAIRTKRATVDDFNDVWIFGDEGNDLSACLKSYSKHVLGESSAPPIWSEAIAPLFRQGRQVRMFGEFMFQDLDGRLFGGETLKPAFSVFGAAGFLPNQFQRTIGGTAPECLEGPGRILMCSGNKREWVQGYCDDPNWLHEYALANRKELT